METLGAEAGAAARQRSSEHMAVVTRLITGKRRLRTLLMGLSNLEARAVYQALGAVEIACLRGVLATGVRALSPTHDRALDRTIGGITVSRQRGAFEPGAAHEAHRDDRRARSARANSLGGASSTQPRLRNSVAAAATSAVGSSIAAAS